MAEIQTQKYIICYMYSIPTRVYKSALTSSPMVYALYILRNICFRLSAFPVMAVMSGAEPLATCWIFSSGASKASAITVNRTPG